MSLGHGALALALDADASVIVTADLRPSYFGTYGQFELT